MVKIKLIPDSVHKALQYNPNTGDFIWKSNYFISKVGTIAGTVDARNYKKVVIGKIPYLSHRLAWFMMTGEQPDIINHKNGNPLDNRFENLENGDHTNNNRKTKAHTSGKRLGIRCTGKGKWVAAVPRSFNNGVVRHLGTYNTEAEAVSSLEQALKEE